MPFLMGLIFFKPKYWFNYHSTVKRLRLHHAALSQGPVRRYVESFFDVRVNQSQDITGSCTQCGNCCLNQQCAFLEQNSDGKFLCGIYTSPFRKFSNCGAFPISEEDIVRYGCPGYALNKYPVVRIHTQKKDKEGALTV
jgi:hypothetical protein